MIKDDRQIKVHSYITGTVYVGVTIVNTPIANTFLWQNFKTFYILFTFLLNIKSYIKLI